MPSWCTPAVTAPELDGANHQVTARARPHRGARQQLVALLTGIADRQRTASARGGPEARGPRPEAPSEAQSAAATSTMTAVATSRNKRTGTS